MFSTPEELPDWPRDDRRSNLVFITRDIARETIKESLGAVINVRRHREASPSRADNGRRKSGA